MRVLGVVCIVTFVLGTSYGAFAQTWPNEPAGSKLILDDPLTQLNVNGWTCLCNTNPGPGISGANIFNDGTAPSGDKMVLRHRFAVGHNYQGGSPGNYWRTLPRGLTEIYEGFYFKVSSGFENHPAGTKIGFMPFGLATGNGVLIPMVGSGTGLVHGPYAMDLYYPVPPTINNCHISYPKFGDCPGTQHIFPLDHPAARWFGDVWYRVEIYIKASTTFSSQDGIYRMWHTPVGGATTLIYNITNINIAPDWSQFELNPTYGGGPQVYGSQGATEDGFFSYDHVRISAPNGDGGFVAPVMITSSSLPGGQSGKPYSATLGATGGKAPYGWTITAGSLHQGLTLNKTTGIISGIPTSCGRRDFTVKVMDSNVPAKEAMKNLTIIVSGTCTSGIEEDKKLTVNGLQLTVESRPGSVRFHVPQDGGNSLRVYDLSGKMVHTHKGQGQNGIEIKVALKNGIYFARLSQGKHENTVRFNVLN